MKSSSVITLSALAHESSPGAEDFRISHPMARKESNEKAHGNGRTFKC
jgi:hypothetical protein